jgi:hypothetical protein
MTNTVDRLRSLSTLPLAARISDAVSTVVLRYGLVLFLLGGGLSKFTQEEALRIQPWVRPPVGAPPNAAIEDRFDLKEARVSFASNSGCSSAANCIRTPTSTARQTFLQA